MTNEKPIPIVPIKNNNEEEEEESDTDTIKVMPFETFKLHDLANMFPFNITPALIESKIAHAIAAKQKMFNTMTPHWAFLIIALMIGGVLAAYIAYKFLGLGTQEVIVKIDYPAIQYAQVVQSNFTG